MEPRDVLNGEAPTGDVLEPTIEPRDVLIGEASTGDVLEGDSVSTAAAPREAKSPCSLPVVDSAVTLPRDVLVGEASSDVLEGEAVTVTEGPAISPCSLPVVDSV